MKAKNANIMTSCGHNCRKLRGYNCPSCIDEPLKPDIEMNDNYAIIKELQARCKVLADRNQKLETDRKKAIQLLQVSDSTGQHLNQAIELLK